MIPHMHAAVEIPPNNRVGVSVDGNAVYGYLMDDENYSLWKQGLPSHGYGGAFNSSPFFLTPPFAGRWNVVVWLQHVAGRAHVNMALESIA